jgi:RNA polymerase sigma-70 factor (ECF subfamily)
MTIAYRVCNNMQDAEDVVQDSFVKAYHNLHTFKAESKFSTWLYSIVYNTAKTTVSKTIQYMDYDQINESDLSSDFDPMRIIEENEKKELINTALQKMPSDESVILTLFYLEDNSLKDISKILGLTESNVKVKLHRARKRLQGILTKRIL